MLKKIEKRTNLGTILIGPFLLNLCYSIIEVGENLIKISNIFIQKKDSLQCSCINTFLTFISNLVLLQEFAHSSSYSIIVSRNRRSKRRVKSTSTGLSLKNFEKRAHLKQQKQLYVQIGVIHILRNHQGGGGFRMISLM